MKVAVGISGGVDSAVAALLLKEAGHEVVGVTMTLGRATEAAELAAARAAAARLEVPLAVVDLAAAWRREVVESLRGEYRAGRTPNPCVTCNERVKFALLPERAFAELGAERFATGHYARLERSPDGRVRLLRGRDSAKDQSYFLYRMPAAVRERTLFPLGAMTKAEVREYARAHGWPLAERADSQDFCGGDVAAFIGLKPRRGATVTRAGAVVGHHDGYWNFTPGMRKGLGTGGGGAVYHVLSTRPAANEVVVGSREEASALTVRVKSLVRLARDFAAEPTALAVKLRSTGEPRPLAALADGGEELRLTLSEPVLGVSPGQSAVVYRGDEVVAGGIIEGT